MIARSALALFLLASTASAELITIDSGHFYRVNLTPDRDLLFTGGTIDLLNNAGAIATIDGGSLTGYGSNASRVTAGGTVRFIGTGTRVYQRLDSLLALDDSINTIELEGLQFRGRVEPGIVIIQGALLDGSFVNLNLIYTGDVSRHRFIAIDHPELMTDPTRDAMFDLADLNIIRNNFGQSGDLDAGDVDGDNFVGLADLNVARNGFGNFWELGPNSILSGNLLSGNAVPEPSTLLIFACAFAASAIVAALTASAAKSRIAGT